jgi:hypothetical protein
MESIEASRQMQEAIQSHGATSNKAITEERRCVQVWHQAPLWQG